jgi:hypothetical protein
VRIAAERRAPAHAAAGGRRPAGYRVSLAWYTARLMAWGPLLTGCLAGIGFTVLLRIFAGQAETPASLGGGIRVAFVPVIAGLAFLLQDPHRLLTAALPVRDWLPPAVRVALALPVVALTGLLQLEIGDRALRADLHAAGQPPVPLPSPALMTELGAWCLVTLLLAAAIGRTRWHDIAGISAAVGAVVVIGIAAILPFHLIPAAVAGMSALQDRQWDAAWQFWGATAVAAAVLLARATGDPWRRLTVRRLHGRSNPWPGLGRVTR